MTFRIKTIPKNPKNKIKFQFYLKTDTFTNFSFQSALARHRYMNEKKYYLAV